MGGGVCRDAEAMKAEEEAAASVLQEKSPSRSIPMKTNPSSYYYYSIRPLEQRVLFLDNTFLNSC
jgi:hypothetical protein